MPLWKYVDMWAISDESTWSDDTFWLCCLSSCFWRQKNGKPKKPMPSCKPLECDFCAPPKKAVQVDQLEISDVWCGWSHSQLPFFSSIVPFCPPFPPGLMVGPIDLGNDFEGNWCGRMAGIFQHELTNLPPICTFSSRHFHKGQQLVTTSFFYMSNTSSSMSIAFFVPKLAFHGTTTGRHLNFRTRVPLKLLN